MNISIASSCEYSSILTSSVIYFEIISNSPSNEVMSLGPILCLHFVTRIVFILKVIIAKTTMSE